MERQLNFATVLLLVCVTGISGSVVIVEPVNKTIYVYENSDVVFKCKYPLNESVEWYRTGVKIQNTTFDARRYSIEPDYQRTADGSVISRLTISAIGRKEGGSYTCNNADFGKALLEEGQSDDVTVKIIKAGAAIHVMGPKNSTVTEGDDLLLICTGDITAELVWHFKGELLTADYRGQVIVTPEENTETGRNRLALTISQARVDDEGLYTCHDEVNMKHANISIFVTETGKVVIVEPENRTITVSEGSDVVFECQHPPSELVEWFHSGMRISNATFDHTLFSIQMDGTATSILTVNDIRRTQAGAYKCSNANLEKALFREGQTDTVNVKVTKANAVVRIERPASNIVAQGDDLRLICNGEMTSDLIWNFNGKLLTPDAYGQVTITLEENRDTFRRRSALTRSRATVDHHGLYKCYDQFNNQGSSVFIIVTPSDGGSKVQYSSTLLAMTVFTAAIVLAISV